MITEIDNSIVQVTSAEAGKKEFGTGFVIHHDDNGVYLLTCAHVLEVVGGWKQVQAGGQSAEVVAVGEKDGLDLAVLRVTELTGKVPLVLSPEGRTGQSICVPGYYAHGVYRAIRRIGGALGERYAVDILNQTKRATVWDLHISDDDRLGPGYSGSPVLNLEEGVVVGVMMTKQGQKLGTAMSVRALSDLWKEMPPSLLQAAEAESSPSPNPIVDAPQKAATGGQEERGIQEARVTEGSWSIPAATDTEGVQYDPGSFIERVMNRLRGRSSSIAFTGTYGVGKTVLLDHLDGRAIRSLTYKPPAESRDLEEAYVGSHVPTSRRIKLSVIPGQRSRQVTSVNQIFLGDVPVDGLVHVVSNGFATLRNKEAKETVLSKGHSTIDSYREYHLQREIEDLVLTLNNIRQSMDRHDGNPSWMLLAVAKVDLYADRIGEAERYYSPLGESDFTKRIHDFQREVGSDNFAWTALPVCAWLEHFDWNGHRVKSQLIPRQRNQMLLSFVKTLEIYCDRSYV